MNMSEVLPRYALHSVRLEIMWGCNLRCTLCGVRNIKHKNLPADKIEEVLKKIPTTQFFTIIGHGEPLLHPEWRQIMEIVERLKVRLNFVTNGMLLTEEIIKGLPPKTNVTFSIDSLNPEIYKQMRPQGDLVKVLGNIVQLMRLRPDVTIAINSIVSKVSFNYINDVMAFAKEFGFEHALLYPALLEKDHAEHYPDIPHPGKVITKPNPCAEPFTSVMIGMDGDVYPCCYIYGSKDKGTPMPYFDEYVDGKNNRVFTEPFKLGNIFTDDAYDLWNHPTMQGVRATIRGSLQETRNYAEVRDEVDPTKDYCRICSVRWGKRC
jgi:MoaA/NifB/PqqE/SkfB family radical SAM enzyme